MTEIIFVLLLGIVTSWILSTAMIYEEDERKVWGSTCHTLVAMTGLRVVKDIRYDVDYVLGNYRGFQVQIDLDRINGCEGVLPLELTRIVMHSTLPKNNSINWIFDKKRELRQTQ